MKKIQRRKEVNHDIHVSDHIGSVYSNDARAIYRGCKEES